ncbi:hypothetical protein Ahy_B01g051952 isoform B [Arachis hypogaea]|uniref:Nuclear transcription factor Y subunit n=1 Tax=Arachis hypogaea TaxID=3818 RepID=A0A445AND3_ARAHY|nr:hypothetical protein Ahy_B01g051952 isoform B [Arachis hypogaea]
MWNGIYVIGISCVSKDMQSKSETANRLRSDPHSFQPSGVCSEPWWHGGGYSAIPQAMPGANASNSSSLECPNGDSESNEEGQSLSNSGMNEEDDDAAKDSQPADPNQSGNYGQENQGMQHSAPSMREEGLAQAPQLELVGHSIACATNPYQDPYYGGMMAAYGPQQLGFAPFIGMPHARMPLPLEMAQEPVYVNAKQYQGILRRRQARAKAELEKKLIKSRKPYLHESRHQHAMRRARGTGGRFAKKSEVEGSNKGKEKDGSEWMKGTVRVSNGEASPTSTHRRGALLFSRPLHAGGIDAKVGLVNSVSESSSRDGWSDQKTLMGTKLLMYQLSV